MRLLLLGLGALALFTTEPGKALQKAVKCKFRDLTGKAKQCEGEVEESSDLDESRSAMKNSNERRPEMGAEENEGKSQNAAAKSAKSETAKADEDGKEEKADEIKDESKSDDEEKPEVADADDSEEEISSASESNVHGISQKKAEALAEKLSAKPSAPEDELKSA